MRPSCKVFALAFALAAGVAVQAQKLESVDRERALIMLQKIGADVRKHYYDPKLHGIDFDARVREAEAKIKNATSLGETFTAIAWVLDGLNDSHTRFMPPRRTFRLDYGWRMQMVGDRCYVMAVKPKSDAEAKRLKPGDEIVSINGLQPTRAIFFTLWYLINFLRPQGELMLNLRSPEGQERQVTVKARVRPMKQFVNFFGSGVDSWEYIQEIQNAERMTRSRMYEFNDELLIWKLPEFNLSPSRVHDLLGRAHKFKALILDLRGNPGGSVETLKAMVGGFLENEVKIGDRVGRAEKKPVVAKPLGGDMFAGKLVVLVDSMSASASELFARVMQLEKRAVVLGDTSSGLVMEGRFYAYQIGVEQVVLYGALITDADLIMADGRSLEHNGVIPDERVLPTGADLAAQRDPVLARAAELLGFKLAPERAGKLFPYEWPLE